ncbi:MAG: glycosyltransferase family 4 protein [Candidatus Electrothrix sp. Rat3]|nr:glycosyltransferase family 4 protein [Candidatus Electrothrix rattekaaiensis]
MSRQEGVEPRQTVRQTVLHIAPTPFFADRGCHIRIRNEVEALRSYPYQLIICTYHHGDDVEGMDIRRIPAVPGYTKLDAGYSPFRFLADFFLFFLVLKTAWQERPALLHCHLHEGALIGWAVKICLFWRKMTVLMDMQGSLSGELAAYKAFDSFSPFSFLLGVFRAIEGVICRMPDLFFCSSQQSCQVLEKEFKVSPEKILLLQDVVPDVFFEVAPKQVVQKNRFQDMIPQDKQIILYTGSLLPGKGVQHIFQAMELLCAEREDLFFVLVGYPLEDAEQYIRQHQLEQFCLLPGQVAYCDLSDWLALGDLALEPKEADSGEASGKLLHYMAAGLPVVCFATENNQKMLGEAGYYAPSCDGQGLAAGVESALADAEGERACSRGEQGRKVARAQYSSAAAGQLLHEVYGRFIKPLSRDSA